jgi:hypothetical protein
MKLQEIKEIANDTGVHAERGYHLKNFANRIVELDRQQRTWVGLTKEERHEISMANRPYCADVMAAHEEELKRRNT